jgi:TolB-like protein/DNA-binding winged helix-turn-helix (wHTH) protein/rhodanese-related sulfurtransferase/cytochrome c-type biogenesis protein CcmH/NrfG
MAIADHVYEFGRFRLDVARRILLADGAPVSLSSRAFDILQLLIELRDRVVTKDEILDRVWQGIIVEENNLSVQISGLRRALGEKAEGQPFIVTIPGRGYRFVGQVAEQPFAPPIETPVLPAEATTTAEPTFAAPIAVPRRSWVRWAIVTVAVLTLPALLIPYARQAMFPPAPSRSPEAANPPASAPRLSIAVLPFRNLSNDPEQDYLADAVSDDLTTELSHLVGSFVIARQSSDAYKGKSVGASQIGRELGVRYVLEGSVRRADDKIFINAQLIDTDTGAHLWADRFDVAHTQLSEAQIDIVQRIGSALNFKLVQLEGQRSIHDRPNNPDALDLFLRARSILDRDDSLDGFNTAQPLLEKAIQLQPDFADAMTELAWLLLTKMKDFDDPTDAEDREEARKAVTRALALAPDNARTLAAKGMLLMIERGCQEASASYRLALSFDPNNVPALAGLARCADELGHPDETAELVRRILRIDPENPNNRIRYHQLGMALAMLGRHADAIEWFERAEAANSEPMWSNQMALIAAYGATGKLDEARARYSAYDHRWPHQTVWRLGCYASKTQAANAGFQQMLAGLRAAGMPEFADETRDDGIAPATEKRRMGDFDPTPMTAPGARTVTTAALAALLRQDPQPVVLDVGCGAATIPGAVRQREDTFLTPEAEATLKAAIEARTGGDLDRPVVAMGSGPYGWGSYNAALALHELGYRHILWYRGGEEAWAAAGMPSRDDRYH